MLLVANGWDGVWSSLLGGALGGMTVLAGVLLTERLRNGRETRENRRANADKLLVLVADLRDAAVRSRSRSKTGAYGMSSLRHELHVSHPLRGAEVLDAVRRYYEAVWELREWIRHGPISQGHTTINHGKHRATLREHQAYIDAWADELIVALRDFDRPLSEAASSGPPKPATKLDLPRQT